METSNGFELASLTGRRKNRTKHQVRSFCELLCGVELLLVKADWIQLIRPGKKKRNEEAFLLTWH